MITYEFVSIPSRPFVTLDYDLTDGSDLADRVGPADHDPLIDGAIVRLRFKATAEQQRRIDVAAIRSQLLDAGAHVVKVEPDIVREDRARVGGVTEDLSPLAALDLYIAENNIESELAERMRDRTASYLETVA